MGHGSVSEIKWNKQPNRLHLQITSDDIILIGCVFGDGTGSGCGMVLRCCLGVEM